MAPGGMWTVETLKAYFEKILEEKDRALVAALAAAERATSIALTSAEKAVTKAEESQLRVNIGQNEFRGALKDQAATLLPRVEADIRFSALESRVKTAEDRMNLTAGKSSGIGSTWAAIGAVVAILLAIVAAVVAFLP